MTENEVIEQLKIFLEWNRDAQWLSADNMEELVNFCTKAFEEIKQYQTIGTVEECQEARERQIPKPPNIWGDGYDNEGNIIYDMYDCPNCCKSYEIDYHDYKYCPECGQAIDR